MIWATYLYLHLLLSTINGTEIQSDGSPNESYGSIYSEYVTTDEISYPNGNRIKVKFKNDTILVQQSRKNDTTTILLVYDVDDGNRQICKDCIQVLSHGDLSYSSGFYVNDSMFLLPVFDLNRIILFGLNFKSKFNGSNDGQTGVFLQTFASAFVFTKNNNQIFQADGIYYDDDGLIADVESHRWQISGTEAIYQKSKKIVVPKTMQDRDLLPDFLLEQLKKIVYRKFK